MINLKQLNTYSTVKEGIIRSVGLMTNMEATQHGVDLLKGMDVCMGLHTNICVGKPLADPSLIPSLIGENGEFKSSKIYRSAKEDFVNLDEVLIEIEAQYLKFVELMGYKPHYFEGHAIMSEKFFEGMQMIAQKYGCEYLPAGFDGPVNFRNTVLHTCLDSMFPNYDPVASLKKYAAKDYGTDGMCMFVCHPGYLDAYLLRKSSLLEPRTLEVEMCTSDEVKAWLKENQISVVTYDDLT